MVLLIIPGKECFDRCSRELEVHMATYIYGPGIYQLQHVKLVTRNMYNKSLLCNFLQLCTTWLHVCCQKMYLSSYNVHVGPHFAIVSDERWSRGPNMIHILQSKKGLPYIHVRVPTPKCSGLFCVPKTEIAQGISYQFILRGPDSTFYILVASRASI